MLTSQIEDGQGGDSRLGIDSEGAASVVVHAHPPEVEKNVLLPFRQYFTDNGGSTGSSDMIVDGSANPIDFSINAQSDRDVYIKSIAVQISDPGAVLDQFGALPALPNGVSWIWQTGSEGEYELHDGIKDNLEFVKLGLANPAFGTGSQAFRADLKGGAGNDTFLPVIDLAVTFGMPWGLRMNKGTNDKLIFRVNDALAGLAIFNIIGYGTRF